MRRSILAALLCVAPLLSPVVAHALPGCWCDPRHSWMTFPLDYCNTNWEVVHTGLLGFVPVCSGTPPACVGLAMTNPPDQDGDGYLLLFGGGFATPRGIPCAPDFLFTTPISIWPNQMPKQALRPIMMDNYRQIVAWQAELRGFPEGGPQWRGTKMMLNGLLATTARLILALYDPPNPDYAHLPPLPTLLAQDPAIAGPGITQATADAINAWEIKSRKLHQYGAPLTESIDNLSGAVLAHQAGDLAAAPWVRRLARHIDTIALGISGKGLLEVDRRTAIAATLPVSVIPATCMTTSELVSHTQDLVTIGADPTWGLLLTQQDMVDTGGLCIEATDYPAVMTDGGPAALAAYGSFPSDVRAAQVACSGFGLCSSLTTTTLTLLPSPPGKLKFQVAVTASDGPYTMAFTGLTVTVGGSGLMPQTLPLVNGVVAGKFLAVPPGTYQLTATFPESKNAKLGASVATVMAVAP